MGIRTQPSQVEAAVAYWRAILTSLGAAAFQTEEDVTKAITTHGKKLDALVDARRSGDPAAIKKAEARLRAEAGVAIYVIRPQPPSADEIGRFKAQHAATLERYDDYARESLALLRGLEQAGGDPRYILSVLLRYCAPQSDLPSSTTVRIRFPRGWPGMTTPIPRGRDPFVENTAAVRTRVARLTLTGKQEVPLSPASRKRPGRAETAVSFGMALLARHLRKTTRPPRPHLNEIGVLYKIWAAWSSSRLQAEQDSYRTRRNVSRRIRRIKQRGNGTWFRRQLRTEALFARALQAASPAPPARP